MFVRIHGDGTVWRKAGLLLTGAVLAAAVVGGPAGAQSANLKSVRDPQNRFTIDVPSSWTVQTQNNNPAVTAKSSAPAKALPDSLEVTVYDWATSISPQDCISESDLVMRYAIHTWTTVKQGSVTVGGQRGYTRVYNWKSGNEPRQSVETCVTHNNRVYVAVGTTDNTPAKVAATMPLIQRSIATLQPNVANLPTPAPPSGKPNGKE
jgi:hypothetical protein